MLPHEREHERHERPPHERMPHEQEPHLEIIEVLERKFRELNERLDDIEARLAK